ncbi:MAG: hypothetical protein NTU73_12675 [Ignavibacteriae bacterium]|nr:hypothetical protein [Ignavibacteriota bacterium]
MKRIILPLFILLVSVFFVQGTFAQGFTPPKMIFGLSLDGNFATNDAHGTDFKNGTLVPKPYGMIWGRGISVYSKFGLGIRKNHRITVSATYNTMINDGQNQIPFIVLKPDNNDFTSYNIISGALGYEYAFNPRCKSKQYLGSAVTFNYISSSKEGYSASFDPAFRIGMQITTGYEFVLDKNFKYGLSLGLKYNLHNIIGTANGSNTMDDGSGNGTYWRRIGVLSINAGFNFYTGVQPYRGVK